MVLAFSTGSLRRWFAPAALALVIVSAGCGGGTGGSGGSQSVPRTLAQYKSQMVAVPAGTFTMGPEFEDDENPVVRSVTLSAFKMGRTEVTVAMWKEFCAATGREMPPYPMFNEEWVKEDHPIVNVTWDDAQAYADWAGLKLPTEAQWEYAASGGQDRRYPWGDVWDETKCVYVPSGDGSTAPVGSKPAGVSRFGLQDMAGNVMEWCRDYYDIYPEAAETDPTGPTEGFTRVYRGGAFSGFWRTSDSDMFRTTSRGSSNPGDLWDDFGFRLVGP